MRQWSMETWLINDQGEQIPATVFEKVTYELHPTFAKPKQCKSLAKKRNNR
jgi:transcription initiation factor IIF auxiliary subunit